MPKANFIHLHLHTDYSLLDGACKIDKLAELCQTYSFPSVAITDHGNMFGVIEFYKTMESFGIKPIIGMEAYIAPKNRFDKKSVDGVSSYHLTLLVKNEIGYKNLMKLATIGYMEGFYYKPRIDKTILKEYSTGLIGLSGCLRGEIPYLIKKGKIKKAKEVAEEYISIFGKDNFYLEIMRLGLEDNDAINASLIDISKDMNIPLVATNDCHYLHKDDAEAHDVLLCLQTHHNLEDKDRLKFESKELYFKSQEEMINLFSDHPDAINNTIRIAENCNLKLELDPTKIKLPTIPISEPYKSADEYLEELARDGLKKRYKDRITTTVLERFNYEIEVIKHMGFASYFLMIKDIVDYAKNKKIPVGPGRGSTVGSLVCYCLGITEIDPLKYGLIFERFLNPKRVSPPDIDIDFGDEQRDEVIKYIKQKYGEDSVSQIITFGTLGAKAVVRDVGRVLNIPYNITDLLAKAIPFGASIKEAKTTPEFNEVINKYPELNKVVEISEKLEGLSRHASTHAAGIAIAPGKLIDFVPLFKSEEGNISTQYSMSALELIGIPKIDILGLKTLTIIENTKQSIGIKEIPMDDSKTYNLIKKGNTIGVFQLESEGMRDILRKLKPNSFNDIMAVLALHRPGPLGGATIDKFIHRKNGSEPIVYLHPKLEPILSETYGVLVYQEQVMQIASQIAGFDLGKADILRRAMSKKNLSLMENMRSEFIEGAKKNGVDEKVSTEIFEKMIHFCGYGFNKSHSAGYAFISYWAAYLKANYPIEFMANTLNQEYKNTDRIKVIIDECKKAKIRIIPPDINSSDVGFVPEDNGIKYGLIAIKNVGRGAAEECIKKRPYKSFNDFLSRVNINRKAIESLIKAGVFDKIDSNRKKLLDILNNKEKNQLGLFIKPSKEELDKSDFYLWEKESFGFWFSGHPLEKYEEEYNSFVTATSNNLQDKIGNKVIVAGIVLAKKRLRDGTYLLEIEDFNGKMECVIFKNEINIADIEKDLPVLIKGVVVSRNDKVNIRVNKLIPLTHIIKYVKWIDIYISITGLEENHLRELKQILDSSPGECIVFLHLIKEKGERINLRTNIKITPKKTIFSKIKKIFGDSSVKFGGLSI